MRATRASGRRSRIAPNKARGIRLRGFERLEPRWMLVSGAVEGTWDLAGSPYQLTANAYVAAGKSLVIQPGVVVQASSTYNLEYRTGSSGSITGASFTSAALKLSSPDVAVVNSSFTSTVSCNAAYVPSLANNARFGVVSILDGTLSQNVTWPLLPQMAQYQLDASLTIQGGATLTLERNTRLYVPAYTAIVINGAMVCNDAEWVQFQDYNSNVGITVNGTLTATDTAFQDVYSSSYNGQTYIDVANGASFTATGCSFAINRVKFNFGSDIANGPTPQVTGNTFATTVYAPATYVPLLENNTSFAVVAILGGTLSESVTWRVMGQMSYYQLNGPLTIAPGATLTLDTNSRLHVAAYTAIVVNGAMVCNDAEWVQFQDYDSNAGITVNGSLTATDTAFQDVYSSSYNGQTYIDVANGASFTATGCGFAINRVKFNFGSDIANGATPQVTGNTFAATVYVPATYVPLLENNTSFAVVSILGGTLSESVTWRVMGQMSYYQLNGALTIAPGATLTLDTNSRLYVAAYTAIVINGTMVCNDAEWVQFQDYDSDAGITVNGSLTATDTAFQDVYSSNYNGQTYIDVANGASFTATGCSFAINRVKFNFGSDIANGPTPQVTGNTFAATVYAPATYVPLLENNTSFAVVSILGGTLSESVTWRVMGQMSNYQLNGSLTIAPGATLTLDTNARLYITANTAITINGSLVLNDAEWVQFQDYDSNVGITVNGSLTATDTAFQDAYSSNYNGQTYIDVANGASFTATGCSFAINWVKFNFGSDIANGPTPQVTGNTFPATVYAPATYVPLLENNTSFAVVAILGGTLSESITWRVMGQMSYYQLNGSLTIAPGATLTLDTNSRLYIAANTAIVVNGAMVCHDAEWVQFQDYDSDVGITVNGSLTATDTAFQDVYSSGYNGQTYIDVANGARFTATGSSFAINRVKLAYGSDIAAASVPRLAGNTFAATVYAPAAYVPWLEDNTSFAVVAILGGTLSENITWRVMGQMSYYQLDGWLTVAAGATLTLEAGTRLYVPESRAIVVNGALQCNDADWVRFYDYNSNVGITVNGSLTATDTAFQDVYSSSYNGQTYIDVAAPAGVFSAAGCTFGMNRLSLATGTRGVLSYCAISSLSIHSGSSVSVRENDFSAGAVTAVGETTTTIDLTRNWWGSGDPAVIEPKITHKPDAPVDTRPLVLYAPVLAGAPSNSLLYVLSMWPAEPIGYRTGFVEVTFNRPIDPATLTAADVSLSGGGEEYQIVDIAKVGEATYRLSLSALMPPGELELLLGPNVTDVAGHLMDQDRDGNPGEAYDDVFEHAVWMDLTAPRVLRHQPSGDNGGTVSSIDVLFSEPIVQSTFQLGDVTILNPSGATVAASAIARVTDSRYRVSFAGQTTFGEYTLKVGPDIRDRAANQLDQDGNGTPGQATDVYQGTFNLIDVDLQIADVQVQTTPLWAGDAVRMTWRVFNSSGLPLLGSWTDAVYLSSDSAWDIGDRLLLTREHGGGLAENGAYTAAEDVVLPPVLPGTYYLIVRADLKNDEKELNREGNNVVPTGALSVDVHPLSANGTPVNGTMTLGDRFDCYRIELASGQNLRLNLDAQATAGVNRVYASWGAIPSAATADIRSTTAGPDVALTVPGRFGGGTLYLVVEAANLRAQHTYALSGQSSTILLDNITPSYHGTSSRVQGTLRGDGFNETTRIEFVAGDETVRTPVDTRFVSPTQMTFELDLPSWAEGVYDVRVRNAGNVAATILDAFRVFAGAGPIVEYHLVVPQAVRDRGRAPLWVEYRNVGDAAIEMPGFVVSSPTDAIFSLDPEVTLAVFPPAGSSETVMLWPHGSGATPGTLQPGESGRLPVYYVGTEARRRRGTQSIEFSLAMIDRDSDSPIDWDGMKAQVRPEWIAADAWEAMWANFVTRTGTTWGQLDRTHSEILNYLGGLGQDTTDVTFDQVLAFAVAEAADVGPSSYLAGGIDAVTPAPGIALVFSRVYNASFESRYDVGPLGRGWSHNWEYAVQVLSNGDVVLRGPGGADRHFAKNGSTYTPLPGDYGVLTYASPKYKLAEQDGTVWQFRSDGLLDFVQDTAGNTVSCTYTNGQLVSLTHTNGSQLSIAYDANGRIQSVTDPNSNGTALVKDILAGSSSSSPASLTELRGNLFFSATDGTDGVELWTSDGTAAGTAMLVDINPGSAASSPANLTNVGGTLFFTATTVTSGTELWKSDGTASGTVLVKDIRSGTTASSPANLTNVSGKLFFTANDGTAGVELWVSDGTAAGTVLVSDVRPGGSSSPANLVNVAGRLFFTANDGTNGVELWTSDGTAAGTSMVRDINSGAANSSPAGLTNMGGTLLFAATTAAEGAELWRSDGTTGGTVLVKDIRSGTTSSSPAGLTNVNGELFFSANDGSSGAELWKSDGMAGGTALVKDIRSGATTSSPANLTSVSGKLYFSATDGTTGVELWTSDGTSAGTALVKDVNPGSASATPTGLTNIGGTLYFAATTATDGAELWRSDGTAAGTLIVKDIVSGTGSSSPGNLANVGGTLFLTATTAAAGTELWTSDGTASGTADDRVTTFAYDASGEYLLSVTTHDSRTTSYTYDTAGAITTRHALTSVVYPDYKAAIFRYDSHGRLIQTHGDDASLPGDDNSQPVTYTYGPERGTVRVSNSQGVSSVLRRGLTGQWTQVVDATSESTLRLTYDEAGLPCEIRGPQGETYQYGYDAGGNVTRIVDPLHGETEFTYNTTLDTLTSVTDARGNGIDYDYDAKGNVTRITYEDGTFETFSYDTRGNVLTWTNRRGNATTGDLNDGKVTYTYDANGQVTSKDYSDTAGIDYSYNYDSSGRLRTATDTTGTTTYTYYATTGWLQRIDYPGGPWFTFHYDSVGRRTTRTDQLGSVEKYAYDAQGRLDRMTDGEDELIVDYDYDLTGRIVKKTLGNGVYTTYDFDAAGQLILLSTLQSDHSLLSRFAYTFDSSGRMASMTSTYPAGDPRASGTEYFTYNAVGQLTRVEYPDGRVVEYEYDAVGNRTCVVDNGVTTTYTTNNMNQYTVVGGTAYAFDADGNLTSETEAVDTTTYAYDAENRLIAVHGPGNDWSCVYDALGNRVSETRNGTTTRFVSDMVAPISQEYSDSGMLLAQHRYANGLVSVDKGSDDRQFYAFDSSGNTNAITGATGEVLASYTFQPYGTYSLVSGEIDSRYEYLGQWGWSETGSQVYQPQWVSSLRGTVQDQRPYSTDLGRPLVADAKAMTYGRTTYSAASVPCDNCIVLPTDHDPSLGPNLYRVRNDDLFFTLRTMPITAGMNLRTWEIYLGLNAGAGIGFYGDAHRFVGDFGTFGFEISDTKPASGGNVAFGALMPGLQYDFAGWNVFGGELSSIAPLPLYAGVQAEWILTDELDWLASGMAELLDRDAPWRKQFTSRIVGSWDPNDKVTIGYGSQGFVQPDVTLPYTVRFENVATATAPAQQVVVTDTLDANLDLDTFEFTEAAFGNHVLTVPAGLSVYETRVDLRSEGTSAVVDVTLSLDRATRQLRAEFIARDPASGWLPEDALVGLLPPNDATGRGEGWISYSVQPIAGLPSGSAIPNQACIVFDYNDPINTPQVVNTIDAETPTSAVTALPPALSTPSFTVSWTGQDETGGSGIAGYNVYLSTDGGPFVLWREKVTETSQPFDGQTGHRYAFYSVATDNVGHVEAAPAVPDAQTVIGADLLLVTSLTPTASGCVVQFSQEFDPEVINLYDVQAGTRGPVDVMLVGDTTGAVAGSLLIAAQQVTWIATGGPLAADHYTLTLRSADNGFKDRTSGALLDGDRDGVPGGNAVYAFTVAAGVAKVVSVPDFARGPSQPVAVPATAAGFPVRLDNGAGVLGVDFTLRYDPDLLHVTGVSLSPALRDAGWGMAVNLLTPGQAIVTVAGTASASSTPLDLVTVEATVPSAAPYGAMQILRLENLRVNEGRLAAVADAAVHKVAFLGDSSGDADYRGLDPSLLSRVVVGLDSGFAAYPVVDPRIVADATGDGTLSALDTAFVARKTVGLAQAEIPDLPAVLPTVPVSGPDPTLSVGSGALLRGETLEVPVSLADGAPGLASVLYVLHYDTAALDIANGDVRLGELLRGLTGAEGWELLANGDDASGTIRVLVYGTLPRTLAAGELVELTVHAASEAPLGTSTLDLVQASSYLNDGQLTLTAVDGAITVQNAAVSHVTGRYLFYNTSAFDGGDPAADARDYDAIAPALPVIGHGHAAELNELAKQLGKQALLPGQVATFVNYSSYAKGINGVILVFDNLVDPAGLTAADFRFRVGNDDAPAGWATAPEPAQIRVAQDVIDGRFPGRPDVVTLVWADENPFTPSREPGAISNQWLQVTVLATRFTGLPANDVFYFGNQIGESGNSLSDSNVDQNDEIGARNHPHTAFNAAPLSDPYDFNRDGKVDQNDEILTRNTPASAFSRIQLITAPSMLQATALPNGSDVAGEKLAPPALTPAIAEALARWEAAGLDAAQLGDLRQIQFVVTSFAGTTLGEASPRSKTVYVDDDAAGHGWFLDPTWGQDEEFTAGVATAGPALEKSDLLTAVMHEMGHVLGRPDADAMADDLMAGGLATGVRRRWPAVLPSAHDAALAGGE